MKRILLFVCVILAFNACNDDDDDRVVIELKSDTRYTFTVTVRGQWTEQSHPNYFPSNAGFGHILASTQNEDNILFENGNNAPEWMKSYFEDESTASFKSYFTELKNSDRVGGFITSEGISAKGSTKFEITTAGSFNMFSLIMKLSPSADWFVGINNINLDGLANGGSATFVTSIWDAGLFSGESKENKGSSTNEAINNFIGAPLNFPNGGINNFAIVTIELKSSEKIAK